MEVPVPVADDRIRDMQRRVERLEGSFLAFALLLSGQADLGDDGSRSLRTRLTTDMNAMSSELPE